jgi:hypothetical protein
MIYKYLLEIEIKELEFKCYTLNSAGVFQINISSQSKQQLFIMPVCTFRADIMIQRATTSFGNLFAVLAPLQRKGRGMEREGYVVQA